MTTITASAPSRSADDRFFFRLAAAMAITVVLGFSFHLLMGRSTFGARPLVHFHGLIFMGWMALFTAQSWLATHGQPALHRRLGTLATAWTALMIVAAFAITVDVTQRGTAPFFFQPQLFLILNPLTALAFLALFIAALSNRKRSDWHRRLQVSATAAILGPAFGRLLPMPLLIPFAFEAATITCLIFPAIGAWRDWRGSGRVHAAWWWGMAVPLALALVGEVIIRSPVGDALYAWVTAGHPGAAVGGFEFGTPAENPLLPRVPVS
jgi:hypothetical protein